MKNSASSPLIRQMAMAATVSAVLFFPIGCASHTATTTTAAQTGEMVNPDGSVTTSTTVTTVENDSPSSPDWGAHHPSAKSNTNPANDTGVIVNKDNGGIIGVDHLSSDFSNNEKGDTALHEKGNIQTVSNKISTSTTYSTSSATSTPDSTVVSTTDAASSAPQWNAQNPPVSTSSVNQDNSSAAGSTTDTMQTASTDSTSTTTTTTTTRHHRRLKKE